MTGFTVERTDRGIGVVRPEGRLTMVSARQLTEAIAGLLDSGTERIVVDLSATEFMDSSGLGALIAGLKAARQAGGDLRIAAPNEQVVTILRLTNLDKVLRPRETVAKAYDRD
ncbi:STAS domain-containing protein [Aeromicrobium sp.]|uniref:STAS domain-containing protein n=1 Tax=Aeromicrobium sp. TaxID=1871063 RepID=UPI0019925F86|nr:STAS domain-containing protein [Aeromicrobium sp.]MBC7630990.1 STAS domain-containing protein [Aeromicrobium sp.]